MFDKIVRDFESMYARYTVRDLDSLYYAGCACPCLGDEMCFARQMEGKFIEETDHV